MLGSGTAEDPYLVATAADLDAVRNDLTAYYVQAADIDLSGYENWVPIGDATTPFNGNYEGTPFIVTNLVATYSSNNIGLFGYMNGAAELNNITIENCDVMGNYSVGALVGDWRGGKINNCKSSGTVTGSQYVGGLVGYAHIASGELPIDQCSSTAEVNAVGSTTKYLGGLIGHAQKGIAFNSCYATGDVTGIDGNTEWAGGLCGRTGASTIENCYATGKVTGWAYLGGLVGALSFASTINNSYAAGEVDDGHTAGGLVGTKSADCNVVDSYYDLEVSGHSDDDGRGTPLTTAEMGTQLSYSGWDFDTVWEMVDGYPQLRWQRAVYPLYTGKDYVYVIPFPGGTMNFGGKEYKFVDYLERFEKEQHLVAGVSRAYEYGGPLVKYGEQTYGFLASGITDPAAEGGFGTYLPDTKRTVLSLADRENFVNFYYIYPALPQVEKPVWVKKVITWKDVPGATAYEVKLFLDTEEQCIDTQLVGPGVQRFDFTYFIDSFMPAGSYHCTVQALAAEVTHKAIVWVDTPGATSYTVNLYNSDGEIVYTDSVAPGVQTYDFTAIIPTLPTGTNYYGVAIPVIPA